MKKLILILIVILILLAAAGGGAAWFFLFKKKPDGPPPPPKVEPAVYLALEPLQVPLRSAEPPYPQLHMVLVLEVPKAADGPIVSAIMPRVKDAFLRELLAKPVGRNGVLEPEELDSLIARLLKQADKVSGGKVSQVLIRQLLRG